MRSNRTQWVVVLMFVSCLHLFSQQNFWNQLNISLNENINTMTVTKLGAIYVGTNKGAYCSFDTGKTWIPRKSGLPVDYSVNSLASDASGNIYAGIYSAGVFKLPNSDTTWIGMNKGLTNLSIMAVAVNPVTKTVFAGTTNNSGTFRFTSGDTTWSVIDTSLQDKHVECFIIDTVNGYTFAGTWSGVFRSTNDGVKWSRIGGNTSFVVWTMAINSKGHLFVGSSNFGIFRSTDNGTNWVPKNTAMFDSLVSNLVVNPKDIIYTSTGMGVFYSTNNGDSWISIAGIPSRVSYVTFDASNYLYAGTQTGKIYRSKVATTTGINGNSEIVPEEFSLHQNFPNPFNPSTIISYSISRSGFVSLKVFNVLGQDIATLVNETNDAGIYNIEWNASRFPSGLYFYRLQTDNVSETKKMIFLK